MRVLLTTDTIGGVWSFTDTLARGLLAAGHAVALVSFGRQPSSHQVAAVKDIETEYPGSFFFSASEVPLEWMTGNDRAWEAGKDVLLRTMDDFAPQLLHTSQMCFGRMNETLPVLVTAHSDVLSWAESTLSPGGLEKLVETASPAWLATYRALVERGLRDAEAVVAPTAWMASMLARLYQLDRIPDIVPNGVLPRIGNAPPRNLQAITAGRLWDEAKGLLILEKFLPPLPFVVAGEGKADRMQTQSGVTWLGPLPHQDLLSLFAESAVYVATSLYEPFGLAPLEAAAHGCAIVARDIPSFREVWGDAALYFISSESLQRTLNSLVNHPRRLRGAQCRARQRAARYTAQATTAGYTALYEKLLAPTTAVRKSELAHA